MNLFVLLRILIGAIFIFSGFEKLMGHYQNFLYVIQSYEIISAPYDEWVARIFPWIEFILGIFVLLGLWTKWSLRGLLLFSFMIFCVVLQAIIRNLPVDECGCFGKAFSLPLHGVILVDVTIIIIICLLIINIQRTARMSLDQYLS